MRGSVVMGSAVGIHGCAGRGADARVCVHRMLRLGRRRMEADGLCLPLQGKRSGGAGNGRVWDGGQCGGTCGRWARMSARSRSGGRGAAAPGGEGVRARRCRRCARRRRRGWWCARAWCLRVSRWGPSASRRPRGRWRGCSRCSVGIDAQALAGPDAGGGRHRGLAFGGGDAAAGQPPPCGSSPAPSPAGTPLRTLIGMLLSGCRSAAVGVDHHALAGGDAAACVHLPLLCRGSMVTADQRPCGSMPVPSPAAIAVCVFIRRLRRWGPSRRLLRRRRGCVSWCSSAAPSVGVHGAAAFAAGADACRRVHRGPPPLGSTYPPSPARICERVLILMPSVEVNCISRRRPGRALARHRRGSACWCAWSSSGRR